MIGTTRRRPRGGFTLVELLVVIAIIGLISAVAIPVVLPALNERRVSESARLLQAVLSGTRDAAIRANAPRGIRLLPDPVFNYSSNIMSGQPLASNRFVAIEPAPDYSEGVVDGRVVTYPITSVSGQAASYLQVAESRFTTVTTTSGTARILNSPAGWQYNIRQGDKIRFNNSGPYYTVAGPIHGYLKGQTVYDNPERYVNHYSLIDSMTMNYEQQIFSAPFDINGNFLEYLNLTNGIDDDGDGWIDEGSDGIDNDGDGIIDPGHNGLDDDADGVVDNPAELFVYKYSNGNVALLGTEYEPETFLGVQASSHPSKANYIISRRPVVSPNAAEVTLPAGVVIDLTTWNAAASKDANGNSTPTLPERSRLPVDPFSGYVDILIDQTGRVVPPGAGSGGGNYYVNSPIASLPFYHFWITEREGVVPPLWGYPSVVTPPYAPLPNQAYGTQYFLLPMPQGTLNYTNAILLKGERRLVTLFTKTGQIVANSIESFDGNDTSTPYYAAQSGTKESQ